MNDYLLGHSSAELERLKFQANILSPITTRLLIESGLEEGMHVLDLGSGPGDVAILAGRLVGPTGSVTGIDRSPKAVELANFRAAEAGLRNVRFEVCDIQDFQSASPFDCVVGRYVMIHQSDPVAFLRKAASLVKTGGALALHEILMSRPPLESSPDMPVLGEVAHLIAAAFNTGGANKGAPLNMIRQFSEAGLPQPELFCQQLIGGGDHSVLYRWAAETLKSVYPYLISIGRVAMDQEYLDTLEIRLRAEAVANSAQVLGPVQITAWVRL
ncbi:class I SAM-dependent methyltransferase [Pseudomonas viridiflava]|uniref:class I SAM-dependent methyltransferase n=1 Tax=Pseudomonas syringae group TaxID=136849 RepID=UPI000F0129FD|nr:class I SAM-dependent methyltransferase [Pseudomonas viridiflava]